MWLMYREQAAPWEYIRLADIQHAQGAASDVHVCVWGGGVYWMMAEVTATGWDRDGDEGGWRDRICTLV